MLAKMEHLFVRVKGCPNRFWLAKRPSDENISIVAAVNFSINNNAS